MAITSSDFVKMLPHKMALVEN